jgi:hypothetical protein
MSKLMFTLIVLTATSSAFADICGIVRMNQGRAAANIIDAQVAKKQKAVLFDDFEIQTYEVSDARVSTKNSFKMDGTTYYPLIVKDLATGKDKEIDIGHTWLVLGENQISLEALTGCGGGYIEDKDAVRPAIFNVKAE